MEEEVQTSQSDRNKQKHIVPLQDSGGLLQGDRHSKFVK